jgi:hypothetical protein
MAKELIGLKTRDNRIWRNKLYRKLEKHGYVHRPSPFYKNGFIIIRPENEFENIAHYHFDTFMFDGYIMYEAKNEEEFINFIIINKEHEKTSTD